MKPLVVRMIIISDATTWSITYDRHFDDCNIFIAQATQLYELFTVTLPRVHISFYLQLMTKPKKLEYYITLGRNGWPETTLQLNEPIYKL